jgi:hypothetical protein
VDRCIAAVLVGALGMLMTMLFYWKHGAWAGAISLVFTLGVIGLFLFGSVKLIRSLLPGSF